MTDRYAVIGHPVAHSKSPAIHAAFARQTGQRLVYEKLEAPLEGFIETAADFFAMGGGAGCNVTVPFKSVALGFANVVTDRAAHAGAANTLWLDDDGVHADNTDGVGLVSDLKRHTPLAGKHILLLGAGGAARGVIAPLLSEKPASLTIANRSADKAMTLAQHFQEACPIAVHGVGFDALDQAADIVINATSASLAGVGLPLPASLWRRDTVAYDMMYGKDETPFLLQARDAGVSLRLDGLGMLVEQAAEAFFIWRGVRPDTQPVLEALRAAL
jgi:shikimate dehydrogenase